MLPLAVLVNKQLVKKVAVAVIVAAAEAVIISSAKSKGKPK